MMADHSFIIGASIAAGSFILIAGGLFYKLRKEEAFDQEFNEHRCDYAPEVELSPGAKALLDEYTAEF